MSWGHKEQSAWSLVRHGLLANVSAGVSVTTECLSGGKCNVQKKNVHLHCAKKVKQIIDLAVLPNCS